MNIELAKRVWKQIIEFPDTFNMGLWGIREDDCHTTACLAGWTMLLSGYSLQSEELFSEDPFGNEHCITDWFYVDPEGNRVYDEAAEACDLLQLTQEQYWMSGIPGEEYNYPSLFITPDPDVALDYFRKLIEAE